jgi:hypothetical protein
MIGMLIVGYVFAIRSERLICREVQVNLAYRWFCKLGIEDAVPDHSAFSRARIVFDLYKEPVALKPFHQTGKEAGLKPDRHTATVIGVSPPLTEQIAIFCEAKSERKEKFEQKRVEFFQNVGLRHWKDFSLNAKFIEQMPRPLAFEMVIRKRKFGRADVLAAYDR